MAIWLGWAEFCSERFYDAVTPPRARHHDLPLAAAGGIVISSLLAVQGQALALTGQLEQAPLRSRRPPSTQHF